MCARLSTCHAACHTALQICCRLQMLPGIVSLASKDSLTCDAADIGQCGATWKAASVEAASRHCRSSSVQRAAARPSGRGTQARRASHSANSRRCVCSVGERKLSCLKHSWLCASVGTLARSRAPSVLAVELLQQHSRSHPRACSPAMRPVGCCSRPCWSSDRNRVWDVSGPTHRRQPAAGMPA